MPQWDAGFLVTMAQGLVLFFFRARERGPLTKVGMEDSVMILSNAA